MSFNLAKDNSSPMVNNKITTQNSDMKEVFWRGIIYKPYSPTKIPAHKYPKTGLRLTLIKQKTTKTAMPIK